LDAPTIFISYSREDGAFVDLFRNELEKRSNVRIVGDFNEIDYSEDWQSRLSALIASAEIAFFIVSPAACQSKVCAWELDAAVTAGLAITPVFFRNTPAASVPTQLASRQGPNAESIGHLYATTATARASLKSALNATHPNVRAIDKARAKAAEAERRFRRKMEGASTLSALVEAAASAVEAPSRLWRRRRAQWAQRAERWAEQRTADRLLRSAEIEEIDRLLAESPAGEDAAPALLTEYLRESRSHESKVAEERRNLVSRGFVEPARRLLKDRDYDAALRRVAAAAILADDPDLYLDLATPAPNDRALWLVATGATPLISDWVVAAPQIGEAQPFLQHLMGARAALSPDGELMVVVSNDGGDPCVYSTRDRRKVAQLEAGKHVSVAMWPPQSPHFFTMNGNYELRAWAGIDFQPLDTSGLPPADFGPEQICSDGTLLIAQSRHEDATGLSETNCWRWLPDGVHLVSSFPRRSGVASTCAISPDGRLAASPGEDGATWVWTVADGKAVCRLPHRPERQQTPYGPSDQHVSLFFTPSGEHLVSKDMHGVTSWRLGPEPTPIQWPDGDHDFIGGFDDELCVTATSDGAVTFRSIADGQPKGAVLNCGSELRQFAYSADRDLVAVGCADCSVRIKRLDRNPRVETGVAGGLSPLICVETPSFGILGIDPSDGSIGLYDCVQKAVVWRAPALPGKLSRNLLVELSGDRTRVAVARDKHVRILNLQDGRLIAEHTCSGSVRSLALSPDGTRLVISDQDAELTRSFDVDTLTPGVVYYPGDREPADAIAFSSDGSVVFSAAGHCGLVAHHAETGAKLKEFGRSTEPVDKIAICEEAGMVLAARPNGSADIYSWDSAERVARLSINDLAETGGINFFPDGSKVLLTPHGPTATGAGAVLDAATGAVLYRLPKWSRHAGYSVLAKDGKRVLVVSLEGDWHILDVEWLEAFTGDRAIYLAAALNDGRGHRSHVERTDILMSSAPDDLFASFVDATKRRRTSSAASSDAMRLEAEIDASIEHATQRLRLR
jgi:WD40 repeat protein